MTRSFVAGLAVVCAVGLALGNGWRTDPVPAHASIETEVRGDSEGLGAGGRVLGDGRGGVRALHVGALEVALTREQRMARIIRATWPDHLENTAIAVFRCESNLNPRAVNRSDRHSDGSTGSYGLAQIGALWRHHPEVNGNVERLLLPWTNTRVALDIYREQGWDAWYWCSRKVGAR